MFSKPALDVNSDYCEQGQSSCVTALGSYSDYYRSMYLFWDENGKVPVGSEQCSELGMNSRDSFKR